MGPTYFQEPFSDTLALGQAGPLPKSRRGLPGTSQVPFRPAWVPSLLASVHVGQAPGAVEVLDQAQVVHELQVQELEQAPPQEQGVEEEELST